MSSAQYSKSIAEFLSQGAYAIFGEICLNHSHNSLTTSTRESWVREIADMQRSFDETGLTEGWIFFEYTIPRVGGRIDCGIIVNGMVFIIEFKTGDVQTAAGEYVAQLTNYVSLLKHFHFESYDTPLIPVLAVENIDERDIVLRERQGFKQLYQNVIVPSRQIAQVIQKALSEIEPNPHLTAANWINSPYCPTSDIVDAARKLFNDHTVEDIKRSDAKGESLERTTKRIMDLIHYAKTEQKKILCMVTGVPGAGKTLIGLSVATQHMKERREEQGDDDNAQEAEWSVYLSGNHPLVTVLQEALARDAYNRKKQQLETDLEQITDEKEKKAYRRANRVTKKASRAQIIQFIQEIYLWRGEYLRGLKVVGDGEDAHIIKDLAYDYHGRGERYVPYDHVAIFDEAQRTWNAKEHANFVRNKSRVRITDFPEWSEARFLISCMDRHDDWAVIICLVGNGQDINRGEAGISDWIESIRHYPDWTLYAPSQVHELDNADISNEVIRDPGLHLEVNLRSPRADNLSKFVDALLTPDAQNAARVLANIDKYPIVMTRDFAKAKRWLKDNAQPHERYGVMASSKAQRLRPLAIDVSHSKDMRVASWFLNSKDDVHSSYYMEDIATEFQVQGLELDWACVAWDGDLMYQNGQWVHRQFRGSYTEKGADERNAEETAFQEAFETGLTAAQRKTGGWQYIRKPHLQDYHINAYRVLLTRARRGMIILIPDGDLEDYTRQKHFYDQTYDFLKTVGIPEI